MGKGVLMPRCCILMEKCGSCGKYFSFNPYYVPSLNNVPFCQECINEANPKRVEKGLPEIEVHPQAYESFFTEICEW